MKNVLVVITTGFSSTGGLTAVMMNYYRSMDLTNLHIDFCSTNKCDDSLSNEISINNGKYFRLPKRIKVWAYWLALYSLSKNYNIVHIHANSQTAAIETTAAKCAGVKKIIVHNHTSRPQHAWLGKLVSPIYHATYTDAIACSIPAGEWIYGNGNFIVLRNAIDVDKFAYNPEVRAEYRKSFGLKDEEFVIGHIGKFMDAKNHSFLIRIFAEYKKLNPQSKLLLIGDGIWRDKVVNSIKENMVEDSVILAGLRSDIPQIVQAFDVFVFPSIYEGLPLTVLEAQSSGLSCVMSSNITKEVHIANNNYILDLDKGEKYWARFIYDMDDMDRKSQSIINIKYFTDAGYNIKTEANNLLDMY